MFDLNAADQVSDTPRDSKAGMVFTKRPVQKDDTLPYWDLSTDDGFLERTGGGELTDGQYYTHACLLKWRASDIPSQSGWRTVFRHSNNDKSITVKDGGKELGLYSNRDDWSFRGSGYSVRAHAMLLQCTCAFDDVCVHLVMAVLVKLLSLHTVCD